MLIFLLFYRQTVADSAHQTNVNDAFNHLSEPAIKEYLAKSQRAKSMSPLRKTFCSNANNMSSKEV